MKSFGARLLLGIFIALAWMSPACADTAQQLFNQLQDRIYQIRLLEQNSENKSIIGSGFQIDDDGLIATNYHVVAGLVQTPEKYKLEYLDHEGNKGSLTLVDIDVVHDLALVRRTQAPATHLILSAAVLNKGDQIYSIGNPQDLGMTIISGSYSGKVQYTYYGRLLFSGSLNPGMSGGPAINNNGEVIGINVSKGGEQLSFLVPVHWLVELMSRVHPTDNHWKLHIEQQLQASQDDMMNKLLAGDWHPTTMGKAQVPAAMTDFISCWSDSNSEDKEKRYFSTTTNCAMKESLFIDENFYTGYLTYRFNLLQGKDINPFQFASLVSKMYKDIPRLPSRTKDSAENFQCHTGFVRQGTTVFKNTICARRYKDYPELYDLYFKGASLSNNNEALVSDVVFSGVEENTALRFIKQFMENVAWTSSLK